jgi:Flp pilus assembly protein TadD
VWDDDAHLTSVGLRSLSGLWRIWFDVGATQQHYPLAHSAFWLMHRLWGDTTLGYHLVNITLHASSAFLFGLILRRLGVPGAWLAALIFAIHPVEVESVAWMTELKNTLSGACYLGAALAYLRFDDDRRRVWYGLAMGLFVLALLSKTVTATLPAALLVVFWWQRGALRMREDVTPLLPFVALGAASGLFTAWVERTYIGAEGASFDFSVVERALIAGRALWFYLGKLVWPANLVFVYPRWDIDAHAWWQYLYPAGFVALVAGVWLVRGRSRAPLAALLLFAGTLFPALGFFNVYPFVFSFVADHFQYLAGLPIIALLAAGLTLGARVVVERRQAAVASWARPMAAALLIASPAMVLTWRESGQYVDGETLYRSTISRNPSCWMAYSNLGRLIQERGGPTPDPRVLEQASAEYREALRLKPDFSQAHNNLASTLLDLGRFDEADAEYREALRLKPDDPEVRTNLGLVSQRRGNDLQSTGRLDEAMAAYREALRLNPSDSEAHHNLGTALARLGRLEEAAGEYEATIRINPGSAKARRNLGVALLRMGRFDSAIAHLADALRLEPGPAAAHDLASAHNEFGVALAQQNRFREAASEFTEAVRVAPDFAEARDNLARALGMIKDSHG